MGSDRVTGATTERVAIPGPGKSGSVRGLGARAEAGHQGWFLGRTSLEVECCCQLHGSAQTWRNHVEPIRQGQETPCRLTCPTSLRPQTTGPLARLACQNATTSSLSPATWQYT